MDATAGKIDGATDRGKPTAFAVTPSPAPRMTGNPLAPGPRPTDLRSTVDSTIRSLPALVRVALVAALLLLALTTLFSAWLCDDAYITFRTVENVVDGYGPRWNVLERVQAYTHPLWMSLLVPLRQITGEIYFTSLVVSLLLTWAAVGVLLTHAPRTAGLAAACVLALALSRSFVDYSTSGLENPLAHFLLAVLLALWWKREPTPLATRNLALMASLLLLCRLDLAVLVAPLFAVVLWRRRDRATWGALLLGFVPLIAWEAFSIAYYGVPFPNTAYAKLGAGLPAVEYVQRGWTYLVASTSFDPLAALVILGGLAAGAWKREARSLAVAAGIVLYLGYVVRIGGDFMAGRYLTAPMVAAVALVLRLPEPRARFAGVAAAMVIGVAFLAPHPVLRTGPDFAPERDAIVGEHGVADERGVYFRATGLFRADRGAQAIDHAWAEQGRNARREGADVVTRRTIGFFGYFAGPGVHVVDRFGLSDPLLARLPADVGEDWRVGHLERPIPAGYLESVRSSRTQVVDPEIAALDRRLRRLTRAPLFDTTRWRAILDPTP